MTTALQRTLQAGNLAITTEVMPPRGGDASHTLAMADYLKGRVHAVNVTDGSRAVMRMSSLAVCRLLLEKGLEPVLQLACRDRNRIALQGDLLGAHALGIHNLLCLTGDPVRAGDQADARPVNEFESVKLLRQVSAFNSGEDRSREPWRMEPPSCSRAVRPTPSRAAGAGCSGGFSASTMPVPASFRPRW